MTPPSRSSLRRRSLQCNSARPHNRSIASLTRPQLPSMPHSSRFSRKQPRRPLTDEQVCRTSWPTNFKTSQTGKTLSLSALPSSGSTGTWEDSSHSHHSSSRHHSSSHSSNSSSSLLSSHLNSSGTQTAAAAATAPQQQLCLIKNVCSFSWLVYNNRDHAHATQS